jgi:hypothetical protein
LQNRPDPRTPVGERRWLDRLAAAWEALQANPRDEGSIARLNAVAGEHPAEARYRIGTFEADARRREGSTPHSHPTEAAWRTPRGHER